MKAARLGSSKHPFGTHSFHLSVIILFFFAALLMGGCGKTEPPPPPPAVGVAEVIQRDVPIYREWIGTLDGMVNAKILAQVSGYLIKQHYQEGNLVKKGQLLYEIDPRVFQSALHGALGNLARQQAVLKTAQLELNRVQRLLPERAVSVRERDHAVGQEASAQAEVISAKAVVENARLQLGFTKIASPINGVAGISLAQLGDLVGPGSNNAELTTLSQIDPIKAYFPMSEQEYLRFAKERKENSDPANNHALELILADGSVYPHPGKFYFADRAVNVKTGTIQVASLFPNPDNLLRPGQYAKIRALIKNKPDALLVPQRATWEMQGRRLVAVVNPDHTVAIRPVKTAETIGTEWVIDEGLKAGEWVIVEGIQKALPGTTVDPKPYAEILAAPVGR